MDSKSGADGRDRGRIGEDVACRFLRARGAVIVERNFHCRGGEIDIVARIAGYLVFVEVRLRSSQRFGSGAESVDGRKRQRLVRAARYYLGLHRRAASLPMRFDVISIEPRGTEFSIEWLTDAFAAEY
jgi:putative endonuclease